MGEKRFSRKSVEDLIVEKGLDSIVDLLNELFEHNLHLQRLIESLAKVTGEPIEDTIERYNNNPVIFHRDQNRKYIIQGFCKWVVEDGKYETLYYGDGQDISNLIDEYLENGGKSLVECVDLFNTQQATISRLKEENKYLKKRIKVISDELYCKDRKLEELGVPIECCDKK